MMKTPTHAWFCTTLSVASILFYGMAASLAKAHHSVVAHYLLDESIAVSGIVEEFWFENPHARIVLNVTTDAGETERWILETGARNNLIRRGWNGEELQPGDKISASGLPARDSSNTMEIRILHMPDGRQFRSGGGSLLPAEG